MEALDAVVNFVKSHFNQPEYKTYKNLQNLLLKAASGQEYAEEFDFVAEKYADDFNLPVLKTQLELFSVCYNEAAQGSNSSPSLPEIKNYFTGLSSAIRCSLSEVAMYSIYNCHGNARY